MGYAAHNALADADLSVNTYKLFRKMCALQSRKAARPTHTRGRGST
ncbi:hypothetical protein H0H10_16660 [Streptomyces sp. TRM S81-3]|uniref:Uncharacterized protein n=1 Tax=Streptomyces griseicoloratus TaxID=2752516 RepID=A0A926QS93_9ACTN|nr:hypothetical protein [Streptomyces griseicoloratus]MBD0420757.1 hypothetical protein [Streptomyces griseicoloratus]